MTFRCLRNQGNSTSLADGDQIEKGSVVSVTWEYPDNLEADKLSLYVRYDYSSEWTLIGSCPIQERIMDWNVPVIPPNCAEIWAVSTYEGYITGSDVLSEIILTAPSTNTEENTTPGEFFLHPIYPNPFNPATTISFTNDSKQKVVIAIYNVKGEIVRELGNGIYDVGIHEMMWDGKDDKGNQVSSGIYFCSVAAENAVKTKKLVLLR